MNCKEAQSYIEEAIDGSLTGSCKRKVDAHLSRCADCRERFAAEKAEHVALFRALKEVSDIPPHPVSDVDFTARLLEAVPAATAKAGGVLVPIWLRRAAVFALICGGTALAAWVGQELIENGESGIENDSVDLVGRGVLDAPESSGRAASPLAASESSLESSRGRARSPSAPPSTVSTPITTLAADESSSTPTPSQGEAKMIVKKLVANVKRTAATLLAGASLGATAEEPYQFIISGYPAANPSRSFVTASTTLETGRLRFILEETPLEARQCVRFATSGVALNSREFKGMSISIK